MAHRDRSRSEDRGQQQEGKQTCLGHREIGAEDPEPPIGCLFCCDAQQTSSPNLIASARARKSRQDGKLQEAAGICHAPAGRSQPKDDRCLYRHALTTENTPLRTTTAFSAHSSTSGGRNMSSSQAARTAGSTLWRPRSNYQRAILHAT